LGKFEIFIIITNPCIWLSVMMFDDNDNDNYSSFMILYVLH